MTGTRATGAPAGPGGQAMAHPGGWGEGDPVGDRLFLDLGPLQLERGGSLPAVRVAYETWGDARRGRRQRRPGRARADRRQPRGRAGRSGPAHPGLVGRAGRRRRAAGHGRFVVCANVLGGCQGTTGPSSPAPDGRPWGSRFPEVTIGDQVGSRPGWPTRWASAGGPRSSAARWAACARWSGRSPGPSGWRRCSSWPRARWPPPTRSAPRPPSRPPSRPTRAGPAVTTRPGRVRSRASASPGGSRT